MSYTDPYKKHFRQKNRQCKGPVAGMSLVCFQGSREACVAEGECAVEEGMSGGQQGSANVRTLAFYFWVYICGLPWWLRQ